jgi:hypothetical protein
MSSQRIDGSDEVGIIRPCFYDCRRYVGQDQNVVRGFCQTVIMTAACPFTVRVAWDAVYFHQAMGAASWNYRRGGPTE